MGQIESSNDPNSLSDRKEMIAESKPNYYSKNLNIDVENNSKANELSNQSEDPNNDFNENKVTKHDFACTIFYAMVAMLIFSTMFRTYTSYSGGGCTAIYGAQPLLAYTCVGLACAIIRSLRKQIKEGTENGEELDKKQIGNHSNDYNISKASTLTESMKLGNGDDPKNESITALPQSNYLFADITNKSDDMLSKDVYSLNSLSKRGVLFENQNGFSTLSAINLKAIETDIEKQENNFNKIDALNLDSLKTAKNQLKVNSEPLKDGESIIKYNDKDYNLNSINKY